MERVLLQEAEHVSDRNAVGLAVGVLLALRELRDGVHVRLWEGAVRERETVWLPVPLANPERVGLRVALALMVAVADERVALGLRDEDPDAMAVAVTEVLRDKDELRERDRVAEEVQVCVGVDWALGLAELDRVQEREPVRDRVEAVRLMVPVSVDAERVHVTEVEGDGVWVRVRTALQERETVGVGVGEAVVIVEDWESGDTVAVLEEERLEVAVWVAEGVGLLTGVELADLDALTGLALREDWVAVGDWLGREREGEVVREGERVGEGEE